MRSERKLLTIAIPTYHRAFYLEALLRTRRPQREDDPRVELIIADNASPDGTRDVVERFARGGLALR